MSNAESTHESISHLHGAWPVGPIGRRIASRGGEATSIDPSGLGVVRVRADGRAVPVDAVATPASNAKLQRVGIVVMVCAAVLVGWSLLTGGPSGNPGGSDTIDPTRASEPPALAEPQATEVIGEAVPGVPGTAVQPHAKQSPRRRSGRTVRSKQRTTTFRRAEGRRTGPTSAATTANGPAPTPVRPAPTAPRAPAVAAAAPTERPASKPADTPAELVPVS